MNIYGRKIKLIKGIASDNKEKTNSDSSDV